MARDHLIRAILPEHDLRILVVHATGLSQQAATIQECAPLPGRIFAQALLGSVLHAGLGKGEQRSSLQLEGLGPMAGLFVDASASGDVRGFVRRPQAEIPGDDVRRAIGPQGYLSVLREMPNGEYYRGAVGLDEERLDQNLEHYFITSEQVPTTVAIEVQAAADGTIARAVGVLAQRLPGGDEKAVRTIAERLRGGALAKGLATDSGSGATVLQFALEGLGELEILEDVPLAYRCSCSRERARRGVASAGRDEILDMAARDKGAELNCEFCKTIYRFDAAELLAILDEFLEP